jgi:hypothetical protein
MELPRSSSPWRKPGRSWPTRSVRRPGAFVSGLDTIFLVAAMIAFAGSVLSLVLVRDRDIEPEFVGEPEGRAELEAGPLAAWRVDRGISGVAIPDQPQRLGRVRGSPKWRKTPVSATNQVICAIASPSSVSTISE